MRAAFLAVAVVLVASVVQAQQAQQAPLQTEPPQVQTQSISVRGPVVRVENDRFVIRGANNKEVTLYHSPQTRFVINGKAGAYRDLRVGTEINAGYIRQGERFVVNTVTVGAVAEPPQVLEPAPRVEIDEGKVIRGRIVRMEMPDRVVVRTAAAKEITVHTTPQTRITLGGRVAQFADLRVGTEVSVDFMVRDGRHMASAIVAGGAAVEDAPRAETTVQGTVIRVVNDTVVVRTGENQEVVIHVDPKTRYLFEDRPGRITDVRTGGDVRIEYDVRDRRPIARIVSGVRRNK
jgi:hypothetical protein